MKAILTSVQVSVEHGVRSFGVPLSYMIESGTGVNVTLNLTLPSITAEQMNELKVMSGNVIEITATDKTNEGARHVRKPKHKTPKHLKLRG